MSNCEQRIKEQKLESILDLFEKLYETDVKKAKMLIMIE
jgi:Asp-tRNA(Asn)/Glu-tRNA(Gln) amidotransferase C subunit